MSDLGPIINSLAPLWQALTPEERQVVFESLTGQAPLWVPFPGPQQRALDSRADEIFWGGAAGAGKAMGVNTPIPTPLGWKRMGELLPGDRVFGMDGSPTVVLAVSETMAERECWKLTFDDGSEIVADAEHRWLTFTAADLNALTRRDPEWRAARRGRRASRIAGNRSAAQTAFVVERNRNNPPKTKPPPSGSLRTTAEIGASVKSGKRTNHAIPVAGPLKTPESPLPLHPYVLGAWLGDGTSKSAGFTNEDEEVLANIRAVGWEVGKRPSDGPISWLIGKPEKIEGRNGRGGLVNPFSEALRCLGVLGNKHVPQYYLRGSREQRLALLQGLMDTDGTVDKDSGSVAFTNTNLRIASAVVELALSLGHKPGFLCEGRAKIDGKDCGPKFTVTWTPPEIVFRLSRKAVLQKLSTRRTTKFRYIVKCERVPSVPVKCIRVAAEDGLFLAGHSMIPTHNSDLLLGIALTRQWTSILFRREYPQLKAMIERSRRLVGDLGQYNSQNFVWRLQNGRIIEFGACQQEKDLERYRGRPHDFIGFDELPTFTRQQYIFLTTWNRPADDSRGPVRCRIVNTGNPPTNAQGRWVVEEWGPWLEPGHPHAAEPGDLRWYAREGDGKLIWADQPGTALLKDGKEAVMRSRTFIPGRIDDNPVLIAAGYKTVLQGLPEPLRSQLLYGDFSAGLQDDAMQVIPTAWIQAAQRRWTEARPPGQPLSAVGVDVARGGAAKTVIARRYGIWFAPLAKHKGSDTPDGPATANFVRPHLLEAADAPIQIDAIGAGSSVYDVLRGSNWTVRGVIFSNKTLRRDRTGKLTFCNLRAYAWWRLREALDPDLGEGLQLPPDPELLADLTAPRWEERPQGILIESKDAIDHRIGRSPDCGDAVVLAFLPLFGLDVPENPYVEVKGRRNMFDDSYPSSARRRGFFGLQPEPGE